jgi:histidinol phosphatase-like PHP family hydrolase
MIFKDDWHIHSIHSCDGACMKIEDLVKGTAEAGIETYGITDHIHTPFNYPDIKESRKSYEKNRIEGFHFGVEVSCVSKWELERIKTKNYTGDITYGIRNGGTPGCSLAIAIDEEYIENNSIEFVVGGTHWAMYTDNNANEIIKDYHRQNMFLAEHPLVDIVAHPWWYYGPCTDGWTEDFSMIPDSYHREFASACISNNKLMEINIAAMLLSRNYSIRFKEMYIEYLSMMKDLGVRFSVGSDCHNEFYDLDMQKASGMLEKAGFKDNDFYSPL